jgi:hypothetical protein
MAEGATQDDRPVSGALRSQRIVHRPDDELGHRERYLGLKELS